MINFTVRPVISDDVIRTVGSEQVSYFRTLEFSKIMLENEHLMKKFSKDGEDARMVFSSGCDTASMEAVVINVFDEKDKVLVANGGKNIYV